MLQGSPTTYSSLLGVTGSFHSSTYSLFFPIQKRPCSSAQKYIYVQFDSGYSPQVPQRFLLKCYLYSVIQGSNLSVNEVADGYWVEELQIQLPEMLLEIVEEVTELLTERLLVL